MATTWNPADKSTAIDLTGGDLTATANTTGWHGVRSTLGKSSGKWYWEVTVTVVGEQDEGILKSTTTLDPAGNFGGVGAGNVYYYARHGEKGNGDGTEPAYGTAYVTGNIVAFAVNFDTGKIWAANNSTGSLVWQNSGDPVAGTGEMFSGISGTFMPFFGSGGTSNVSTANFSATPTYTPPSGFSTFDVAPISISVSDQLNITESTTFGLTSSINVSDQLNITESIQTGLDNYISVNDSLSITESVSASMQNNISVSDQLNITESVTFGLTSNISVSDQLNITENITKSDIGTPVKGLTYLRGQDQSVPATFTSQDYPLKLL